MFTAINPKLPMRNKEKTKAYYIGQLGFTQLGDYGDYLMIQKDSIEIHFFLHPTLDIAHNYSQVYIRTSDIDSFYQYCFTHKVPIHPHGPLQTKPWGQREFSLLDPDNNLLTFGQSIHG